MSNVSNSYNLISNKTLSVSRDYHNIKISKGDWYVIGQMKAPIQFQMNAEYGDLIGTDIPGTDLLKKLGNTSLSSGIFSQKYFSGGGHLALSLEFRVNEGQYQEGETNLYNQGQSKVTEYADRLAQMVATDAGPQDIGSFVGIVKGFANKLINFEKSRINVEDQFAEAQGDILGAINSRTVEVNAGTLLRCDGMIITSLGITYSKELTKVGPLYGDFVVGVESIQALQKGDTGRFAVGSIFRSKQAVSRINVISNSTQNNDKQ